MNRTWISWSTGKDSAWVLNRLLDDDRTELCGLITTVDSGTGRVPFQGTGRDLLELQAAATGLPLRVIELPPETSDVAWKQELGRTFKELRDDGVQQIAYGDLHLADLRAWREEALRPYGLEAIFPLWGAEVSTLALEMIDGGLEARISCVDPARVDEKWLGEAFDRDFLAALPDDVDACGEKGEFHTFVCAGPMLHDRIDAGFAPAEDYRGFRVAEPVLKFPLDGTLDLHGIPPKEVGDLVDDWIDACRREGLTRLRIVHGKGIGALRATVHARLRRRADIAGFRPGGEGGGGWGATLVDLEP
jgi:uncharacterized protein (TIGR00290 family)